MKNGPYDVVQRYRGVQVDPSKSADIDPELLRRLRLCSISPDRNTRTPLLRSPVIRAALRSRLRHFESVSVELKPHCVSLLDFAEREIDFFYARGEHEEILAKCQVMPIIFAHFLTLFSAFMVHSSGLAIEGRTAIFLAPDEGGKTTIATLSPKGTILCDDQVVLRKQEAAFMAYGSPWGQISHRTKKARLGGFFLLEKAECFKLLPVKPKAVFAYLWNAHESYRFFLPKSLRLQAFSSLYEACQQVPGYRLCFSRELADWRAINKAMR